MFAVLTFGIKNILSCVSFSHSASKYTIAKC